MTNKTFKRKRTYTNVSYDVMKYVRLSINMLLVVVFGSCNKANEFYDTLDALPQIVNTTGYAYNSTYIVGDTLKIVGKLNSYQPDFSISIGGVSAEITDIDSVAITGGTMREQVSLLITEEMAGRGREVKVSSGGHSTMGASINVYTEGGEGSFDAILSNRLVASLGNSTNVFLHCISGKGEVYYYDPTDNKLYRIEKDGTQNELYDFNGGIGSSDIPLSEFVAGGVTPDGETLYFSAKTADNDYVFARIDLANTSLSIINRSAVIASPYQGNANSAQIVVSGIYPKDNGTVYIGVGFHSGRDGTFIPGAFARYNSTDNSLTYVFKEYTFFRRGNYTGMPGTQLDMSYTCEFRVSPTEDLLYLIQSSYLGGNVNNIDVYELSAGVHLQNLESTESSVTTKYNVVNVFSGLSIPLTYNEPGTAYGYLPVRDRRLQVLMYQQVNNSVTAANQLGFPRWIVLDFEEERTYSYAKDRFRIGSYAFRRLGINRQDLLLNYDEEGNLYSTANGLTALIATRPL